MKKICIITQCSLPVPATKGGAVETLAEYLINENEKKPTYIFTVVTVKDEHSAELKKKYKYTEFIFVDSRNKRIIEWCWRSAYRLLKHAHIYIPFSRTFLNALHAIKNLNSQDLYLYLAGPTTQIPLLSKIIDKNRLLVHLHWDGMGTAYYAENCKEVIAISEYIAGQWRTKTGCDRVKVVKNCVNVDIFSKKITDTERLALMHNLGINEDEKVILFVGRIIEAKGIRELISAFENIHREKAVLLIIGASNFGIKTNTPYEKEIAELINKSAKKIIFTGYVHQSELYKYYSLAAFSVMPSQFQEPAGLVAIEAQATGTPLIATNVGGLNEYCSSSSSILVEKDDNQVQHLKEAMEYLLDYPEVCTTMGENGREFACKFNSNRFFADFSNVFDDALQEIEAEG